MQIHHRLVEKKVVISKRINETKNLFEKTTDDQMKTNFDKYHLIINRNSQMEIEVENKHGKSKK